MSLDVGDGSGQMGNGAALNKNNSSMTSNNTLSKFHRSMSMGQGWSGQCGLAVNRYGYQPDGNCEPKVVMRRKNNKVCDAG